MGTREGGRKGLGRRKKGLGFNSGSWKGGVATEKPFCPLLALILLAHDKFLSYFSFFLSDSLLKKELLGRMALII